MVSASLLGALAGSAVAFFAGNRNSLGRRKELLLASALYGRAPPPPPPWGARAFNTCWNSTIKSAFV